MLQTAVQESVVESKKFPKLLGADCLPMVLTTCHEYLLTGIA
jgi:hypothetical protein